jgi:hypothetical protein
MIGYSISLFNTAHSILARSASGPAFDPDAQAFITAAAITDPTQQAAINTLVVDLKGYSIWTKWSYLSNGRGYSLNNTNSTLRIL